MNQQHKKKHVSGDCKCKFNGGKCNLNQNWNSDKRRCGCKNSTKDHVYKEDYVSNTGISDCEIYTYLKQNVDDLLITCDEIIDLLDTVTINLNDKKQLGNHYVLYTFYWKPCY